MTQTQSVNETTPVMNPSMTMTEAAAKKASELIDNAQKDSAAIRVFVKSGGCSGYSYGMAIDDRELEGDSLFEDRGVRIVVDKMSLPLVNGSQIDYVENMMGGGFSVNNPHATSACGCGSSFRTDGKQAPEGQDAPSCH